MKALNVYWSIEFKFKCMKQFIEFIRIHRDWMNLNFIDPSTFKAIITLLHCGRFFTKHFTLACLCVEFSLAQ